MMLFRKIWWLFIVLLAICLGVWVVIDNPDSISLKLFGFDIPSIPGGLWLLITFAVGCVVALLISLPTFIKLNHRIKRLQKQLVKLKVSQEKTANVVASE